MMTFRLEQHVRTNKLKFTSLTDQLGRAADLPDMFNEASVKSVEEGQGLTGLGCGDVWRRDRGLRVKGEGMIWGWCTGVVPM